MYEIIESIRNHAHVILHGLTYSPATQAIGSNFDNFRRHLELAGLLVSPQFGQVLVRTPY